MFLSFHQSAGRSYDIKMANPLNCGKVKIFFRITITLAFIDEEVKNKYIQEIFATIQFKIF
jgi:hypothetical protein